MKGSIRQLSMAEPLPYPTIEEMPSRGCILAISELNERLAGLSLDMYSMFMLSVQVKTSMMHLECSVEYYREYAVRLMALVHCIFDHYGIDRYHFSRLLACIRYCNGHWKRTLIRRLSDLNSNPAYYQVFIYKMNRNIYLFAMLRTWNTILQKMVERLMVRKQLGKRSLKYLQHCNIWKCFENVVAKMVEILEEKQEETTMKLHLVNEFIKYVLLYLNFCLTPQQQNHIFSKFFLLIQYSFRIIKKFYSPQIQSHITNTLSLLNHGLIYYIRFLEGDPRAKVRVQQAKLIFRLLQQTPPRSCEEVLCDNAFVIRLLLRILGNWKKVHQRAERGRHSSVSRSTHELSISEYARKQKENTLKLHMEAGKINQVKLQFTKLNKSRSTLHRRRSLHKLQGSAQTIAPLKTIHPANSIKIRNQIEGHISHYFEKIDTMKAIRSFSRQRKRCESRASSEQQRELRLEDYAQHYNGRGRMVAHQNKIKLYRADKMSNYYRNKPKLKLQAKDAGNGELSQR